MLSSGCSLWFPHNWDNASFQRKIPAYSDGRQQLAVMPGLRGSRHSTLLRPGLGPTRCNRRFSLSNKSNGKEPTYIWSHEVSAMGRTWGEYRPRVVVIVSAGCSSWFLRNWDSAWFLRQTPACSVGRQRLVGNFGMAQKSLHLLQQPGPTPGRMTQRPGPVSRAPC